MVGGERDVFRGVIVLGCYSCCEVGEGEEGVYYWGDCAAFLNGQRSGLGVH